MRVLVRLAVGCLVVFMLVLAAFVVPPTRFARAAGYHHPSSDFNGDGYQDQAIGGPAGAVNGRRDAGYFVVSYGSSAGLSTTKRQFFSQDSAGVPGTSEAFDWFGNALAAGDFNGDGYDDLAVGALQESIGTRTNAGSVTVFFGGAGGLGHPIAFPEPYGSGHYFGQSLAASDVNGGHRFELVIAGSSDEAYVASFGPAPGQPSFTNTSGAPSPNYYATELGAGDINGDGYGDIILGNAGGHAAFYLGGPSGLGPRSAEFASAQSGDIALGDINGDGRDDIVTSDPQVSSSSPGFIELRLGTADGLGAARRMTQDSPGVPGANEPDDEFGTSVAVGDVTGDGNADVLVGVPLEDVGRTVDTGMVILLRGSATGLSTSGATSWHENSAGVPGANETDDEFGATVSLIDHNRDGRADPTVTGLLENNIGYVWFFRGASSGRSGSGAHVYGPTAFGVAKPTSCPFFGESLLP